MASEREWFPCTNQAAATWGTDLKDDIFPVMRTPLTPGSVFHAAGVFFVILGGIIAAVTSPMELYRGSWLAAYLVLVCGVAQAAMGRAQESLPSRTVPRVAWRWQFLGWNAGNALVIAGTLRQTLPLVYAGGLLLLAVIATAAWVLRGGVTRNWGWLYAALLVILAVSIPTGLVLAHLRG